MRRRPGRTATPETPTNKALLAPNTITPNTLIELTPRRARFRSRPRYEDDPASAGVFLVSVGSYVGSDVQFDLEGDRVTDGTVLAAGFELVFERVD